MGKDPRKRFQPNDAERTLDDAVTKANYRRSQLSDNGRNCPNCIHQKTNHIKQQDNVCGLYEFLFQASHVCDSHRFRDGGG